jgi:hypothetical protein
MAWELKSSKNRGFSNYLYKKWEEKFEPKAPKPLKLKSVKTKRLNL